MTDMYYKNTVGKFIIEDNEKIFGVIADSDPHDSLRYQKDSWMEQIKLLKRVLAAYDDAIIIFEYTIPRMGGRIDNVVLYHGIVFILEFKVGAEEYSSSAIVQARTYAFDLSNYHKESHSRVIVPILVATEAPPKTISIIPYKGKAKDVICCNKDNLKEAFERVLISFHEDSFDADAWIDSKYLPAPTIIEAAEELYKSHSVQEIAQNDAAENLDKTFNAVKRIIDNSKANHEKAICFITGVPGAGKTLAGLNIAIEQQKTNGKDYACFLSGNFPLVNVLQEALAQDKKYREGGSISEARETVKSFVQMIHHFRDRSLIEFPDPPADNVVIFDEAQRAWHSRKLSNFMKEKKQQTLNKLEDGYCRHVLSLSEPELLIEYMDRHKDWAVIICLVGGGQDINDGEAGIEEWFSAIKLRFPHWKVHVSNQIVAQEYIGEHSFGNIMNGIQYKIEDNLHLAVSIRSFRSENVSEFIKAVIDVDEEKASALYKEISSIFPIMLTRDLDIAKAWIRERAADGNGRYGIIASSKGERLRASGIWVKYKCDPPKWFLNGSDDINSSYMMEVAATEFDIQGLEIDWAIIGWDADFRMLDNHFDLYKPSGSRWQNIKEESARRYLKNAYRVLLTRARQGFIIFVPEGSLDDKTRLPEFYDGTYQYLKRIGIEEI